MSKANILVVEDQFIVGEDLARSLRKLGFSVCSVATSGEEAIEQVTQFQPDLALMDIRLKGQMDGIEAAAHLKRHFNIPVIYLTAHSDDSTLQRASETEPLGYLLKPFEERQLYTTLEIALNRKRVERSNFLERNPEILEPATGAGVRAA